MRPSDWSPVGLDSDPTPGDPVLVLSGGQEYLEVADSIDNAASSMSRLDVDGTISQAVDALMATKEETIGEIRKAHGRYAAAGDVNHTNDPNALSPHYHAGQPKSDASRDGVDFGWGDNPERYQQVGEKHHYYYPEGT